MGEFEILDTEEPLKKRMERHAFDRLIMLSDGVFAIAITLAALEIRPPEHWIGLAGLWNALRFSIFAYLISFVVTAAYWISQRDLLSRMRKVDGWFTTLALAQLLFVALVPAATQLIYRRDLTEETMQLYAATIAICGYLAAGMWAYGSFKPGLMALEARGLYRWVRLASALVVPVFFTWVGLNGWRNVGLSVAGAGMVLVLRRFVLPRMMKASGGQ